MTSSATLPGADRTPFRRRERKFVEMWGSYSRGSPGIAVPTTYLQVIGVRS